MDHRSASLQGEGGAGFEPGREALDRIIFVRGEWDAPARNIHAKKKREEWIYWARFGTTGRRRPEKRRDRAGVLAHPALLSLFAEQFRVIRIWKALSR